MRVFRVCEELRDCVIKEENGKFCLYTKDGKKKLGEFDTMAEAEAREKQIEMFKHKNARGLKGKPEGTITVAKYQGRDHLVVPVVALVEGVIHASNAETPELVLSEEFQKNVSGWNGRPVMLNHPSDGKTQVSANDPRILDQYQIGSVFNARVEDKKLKMDAYLDMDKMDRMSDESRAMLARLKSGKINEVSVGTFVVAEPRDGKVGDSEYKAVWREIASDHLAFLPEGIEGACSVEMGCGTRAASSSDLETIKRLLGKELFDEVVKTVADSADAAAILSASFAFAERKKKQMDKKTRIAAIIASGKTCFKTADAAVLEQLPDERLTEIEEHVKKLSETPAAPVPDPKIKAIVDAAEIEAKKTPEEKREEFLKANPDIAEVVSQHKAAQAKKRTDLVGTLKAAQKVYSEAELTAMPLEQLEKLATLVKPEKVDFSGQTPRAASGNGNDEPVPPPPSLRDAIVASRKPS